MPEPIADPADVAPWKAWTENLSLITEPAGGFADDLQLALDGRDCFRVRTESLCIHAERELLDGIDGFDNVA